jgi:hypothetical protein
MAVLAEEAGSMGRVREEDLEGVEEATSGERASGAESHLDLDYGKRVAGHLGEQVDGEIAGAVTPLILEVTRLARMAGEE